MALLHGPLMSLAASGTFAPGFAIRRRGLLNVLERPRGHAMGANQAFRTRQSLAMALSDWWHRLPDAERLSWQPLVPSFGPTRYHAYMRYNLSQQGNFPQLSAVWPYAPIARTGGPATAAPEGGPQRITYSVYPYGLVDPWLAVAIRTQRIYPPMTTISETAYWALDHAGINKCHETHLAPGVWPVWYNIISRSGWRYALKYGGPITVTP